MPSLSCSTDLLIVLVQAVGNVVVNDKADARLIDAHTEGNRGDHDVSVIDNKSTLMVLPYFAI